MKAVEVFTPGKLPAVTYVDDHLKERSRTLIDALETGGVVISLSGPSKSGKTVFVEKNIGRDRLIQVTGAGITSAKMLWDRVFDIVGTPVAERVSMSEGGKIAVSGGVEAGGGVIPGKVSGGIVGEKNDSVVTQQDFSVDYLQLLIRELRGTGMVVFIDDFHYIPKVLQIEISNQIKEAIRNDVLFIVASVPYHADDAIRANPDLRGRSVKIDFNYWTPTELEKIAEIGFVALNMTVPGSFKCALSSEAAGSPQLMQALCLNTCFEADVREATKDAVEVPPDNELVGKVCQRVALLTDYSSTVVKMKEGPKTRGQERKSHLLGDGQVSDIYPIIVKAIALDPPELTIRYANLQKRIAKLVQGEQPSGSSITGTCAQIAAIANDSEAKAVLEWDGGSDVLDIRDPYLLFHLRWSE